jgi:hypothetical protein
VIPETAKIDELILRVPGLDRDQARQLADEVAELLARELPGLPMLPAGISLRLRIDSDVPPRELAAHLAQQILSGLR